MPTHTALAISSDSGYDYAHKDNRGGRGHGGVAVLAKKELNICCVGRNDNTRVIPTIVKGHGVEILLIAAYLPTGTEVEKIIEYQETIGKIGSIIDEHGQGRIVLVGADFNVDLTRRVHRNRQYLLEMMHEYNLVIPAEDLTGKYTFYRNDTEPVSLIDYFLIDKEHLQLVDDYMIPGRSGLNKSDHEPVLIKLTFKNMRQSIPAKRARIDWVKARKEEKLRNYQHLLGCLMPYTGDIESIVTAFKEADRILPRRGRRNKASQWWNPALSVLRHQCLSAKKAWRGATNNQERRSAEEIFRSAKRKYLNEQREQRLRKQAMDDQKNEEECKKLSVTYFRRMARTNSKRTIGRIQVDGQDIFEPRQIAEVFLAHFVKTGKPIQHSKFSDEWERIVTGVVETACDRYEEHFDSLQEDKKITEGEVAEAIKTLKRNKATGVDEITSEHLIEAGPVVSRAIADCLQNIMDTASIPENFKFGLITPVYKGHGSDPAVTDSYRDISVLTILCKVFEKVLVPRLNDDLAKECIPSELQFAYHKRRSTLQANFILQEVISYNENIGKTTYAAFLDVKKCFNSIWHKGIIYKLICTGVSPHMILVLRKLYEEFNVRVKVATATSKDGRIEQGLKQGGVLSTSLLNLFMDDKIRALKNSSKGAMIGEKTIPVIAYADDEVILSTDSDELQEMLDIVYEHSMIWRYRYNASKSKVIVFGKDVKSTWRLGTEDIQRVDEYTHLGVIMSPSMVTKKRIEEGMNKARRAFYARSCEGMNIKRISPLTLHTTWKVYAEPALAYSLAVTNFKDTDIAYLERMLVRLYRLMQGLPYKSQKIVACAMIGAPTAERLIQKIKMQFIGFILEAAKYHDLTRYVIVHGAANPDRSSSLTRQWNHILNELKLPTLIELLYMDDMWSRGRWHKICRETFENGMKADIEKETKKMHSIHWLAGLISKGKGYNPPAGFWPASRYSAIERLATLTKIRLLIGHSCLATSLVKRHTNRSEKCPLCEDGIETLEHFIFECQELVQERQEARMRFKIELRRECSATRLFLEASNRETRVIHYIYTARTQKEISLKAKSCIQRSKPS